MKQHEREYFVSRLRSGVYCINHDNISLKVVTPTLEDEFQVNEAHRIAYQQALDDDLMTEEEMLDWMRYRELWTEADEEKLKGLEKDLERLKVEIFNNRYKEQLRDQIRKYIRAGEEQHSQCYNKKYDLQANTCEGIAALEKSMELIKRCTFIGNEPFDFQSVDINQVLMMYHSMLLSEKQVRELARSEPWKALWTLNETKTVNLFMNQDRELSIDQKNILIWSRMYDNIQESMDCPSDDVIVDDDMLDGWFIIQRKKQDKERAERELGSSTKNSKITDADEVFVMAGSQNDIDRINTMNSTTGQMTKKERMAVIHQKGDAKDLDFRDQQLKVRRQSNEQYKGKFGR
jgi:hypothetical protein